MKLAGPIYSIPISEKEQEQAQQLRKYFEVMCEHLDDFSTFLRVFFDNLDNLDEKTNIASLAPLISKYKNKLQKKFNSFVKYLSGTLEFYHQSISDAKFDNIRDLLIQNAKSMRDGLIDFIKLLKNIEDPDFIKKSKDLYLGIKNDIDQIQMLVKKELFLHIDKDYLGKIRLSLWDLPISIRG